MSSARRGPQRRRLDAVLLLDKPTGMSSNAALQEAKRLYGTLKAGHAGTLDPLASGLLPLLFGEATKLAQFALGSDKEYLAQVRLGVSTATGDAEGEVLERRAVRVDDAQLARALERFRGEIEQIPPMHSALKRGGRPLYALAREGRTVERAPRRVTIHQLELIERAGDVVRLRIRSSKGTYVRQIAQDLGAELGSGAHLEALRRTALADFRLEQAVSLDELRQMDEAARAQRLMPLECLLAELPRLKLDAAQAVRFVRGQTVALEEARRGRVSVYGDRGALLGVGELRADGALRPLRLLARDTGSAASS
ncbi:MAG: tRNA pseudouridine(55) synthase TruB [Burkholderiales bacterium]